MEVLCFFFFPPVNQETAEMICVGFQLGVLSIGPKPTLRYIALAPRVASCLNNETAREGLVKLGHT
jgi:hypothetical protein